MKYHYLKRTIAIISVIVSLILSIYGTIVFHSISAKVKKLTFDKKNITMFSGDRYQIKIKNVPRSKIRKNIRFKISKKGRKIISINKKGIITAKNVNKTRKTKVIVTYKNKIKIRSKLKVSVRSKNNSYSPKGIPGTSASTANTSTPADNVSVQMTNPPDDLRQSPIPIINIMGDALSYKLDSNHKAVFFECTFYHEEASFLPSASSHSYSESYVDIEGLNDNINVEVYDSNNTLLWKPIIGKGTLRISSSCKINGYIRIKAELKDNSAGALLTAKYTSILGDFFPSYQIDQKAISSETTQITGYLDGFPLPFYEAGCVIFEVRETGQMFRSQVFKDLLTDGYPRIRFSIDTDLTHLKAGSEISIYIDSGTEKYGTKIYEWITKLI